MTMRISLLIVGLFSMACLWDVDTVEMEFQQFPGTIELISGHFLRHSPEYYYWRIKDREQKLKNSDSLKWQDDLAVAYSKLGQDKKAIEIATAQLESAPHRYETLANLGTFYIHDGQYRSGLAFLEEAIKINPEAHFGREKYQILLVQYLLSIDWPNKKMLPLDARFPRNLGPGLPHNMLDYAQYDSAWQKTLEENPSLYRDDGPSFYDFVLADYRKTVDQSVKKLPQEELAKAIAGVSGMVKFGNFDSPVLMDALAELLAYNNSFVESNRHLAIIAYLRAANLSGSEEISKAYYHKIGKLFEGMWPEKINSIEKYQKLLDKEVAQAEAFAAQIRADEISWIKGGRNPEVEFANKYYQAKGVKKADWSEGLNQDEQRRWSRYVKDLDQKDKQKRVVWEPRSSKHHIPDSAFAAWVDRHFAPKELEEESSQELLDSQPCSFQNWYIILALIAILIGGFYAYRSFKK